MILSNYFIIKNRILGKLKSCTKYCNINIQSFQLIHLLFAFNSLNIHRIGTRYTKKNKIYFSMVIFEKNENEKKGIEKGKKISKEMYFAAIKPSEHI